MSIQEERDIFKKKLQSVNLSATIPRTCIYSSLMKAKKPLSVEALSKKLITKGIDQATVYRTLKSFEKAGLVSTVMLGHGHAHYLLADKAHHAHYIVCREGGYVEDIRSCFMSDLEKKTLTESKSFSVINGHVVEMFGVFK